MNKPMIRSYFTMILLVFRLQSGLAVNAQIGGRFLRHLPRHVTFDTRVCRCTARAMGLHDRLWVWTPDCTERGAMKPYAVWLLEKFRAGVTASELAEREGIPLDRIWIRLDAAMLFERMRNLETNAYAERRAA